MIEKKIILRTSNELGNQMFMYASAYAIAKKMDRTLYIDDETAFKSKKNISNYGLLNFKISTKICPNNLKFLGTKGYLKRKFYLKLNYIKKNKNFLIEKKDKNKITSYDINIFNKTYDDELFLEGHFETEKYFLDYKTDIKNEFYFKDIDIFKKSPFYSKINIPDTVSICLRQNRFNEGFNKKGNEDKSKRYSFEQIKYINNSINFFKKKLKNPKFFIWSNDFTNVDNGLFDAQLTRIIHDKNDLKDLDKRALDLFLITQAKNHIVVPSTFNWWGAWLCNNKEKIVTRPSSIFFSDFTINNLDFWPTDWIEIS